MIKKIRLKYFNNEFFRHVFTMSAGSFFAQLIPVLAALILTRLFSAEVFGIFFIYSSIFGILTILSSLRLEMAILLPDNQKEAINLLFASILTSFIFSLLALIVIIFFHHSIALLLKVTGIEQWLYFVPISIFTVGSFQSLTYWSNRNKKYNLIAHGKINRSLVSSVGQIISGIPSLKSLGLVPGLILGQISSIIFIFTKNFDELKMLAKQINYKDLKFVIKKYKDIPLFNTIINVIGTLSAQLPIYMFSPYFGSAVVGYYGLSNKIIRTPISLIGESIGQVAYREASELLNKGESVYKLIKRNYLSAFKISFIPYLILFLTAPYLFKVFGKEWIVAGEYTQILAPFFFVNFLNSTNPYLFTLLNKQKIVLVYDSLGLVCRFLSIYLGYKIYHDVKIVLILFSGVSLVFNLVFMLIIFVLAKRSKHIIRYAS